MGSNASRRNNQVVKLQIEISTLKQALETEVIERQRLEELVSKLKAAGVSDNISAARTPDPMRRGQHPAEPAVSRIKATLTSAPKIGDHIISHWVNWQYYPATLVSFDQQSRLYQVAFDDGDTTNTFQKVENVAKDRSPNADEVAVGSMVLFPQGTYSGSESIAGGFHYHLGIITSVRQVGDATLYDGKHAKGTVDGKWIDYPEYSFEFLGYSLAQLRVPPNVLDVLLEAMSVGQEVPQSGVFNDVFFCYSKLNSKEALDKGEVLNDLPPSYGETVSCAIEPRRIKRALSERGFSVWVDYEQESDYRLVELVFKSIEMIDISWEDMVMAMKQAKVVVVCISNEYASSDESRKELQFLKKTLNKPAIPVIVGGGPHEWQMSLVGLLIAGELYIDFQDTSRFAEQLQQLETAVREAISGKPNRGDSNHPRSLTILEESSETDDSGKVFLSYCWSNSYKALQSRQVSEIKGNKQSDPRDIAHHIETTGLSTWLDTQYLKSGSTGLFEKIAQGLKQCEIFVPCVSDEYVMSDNCRMEFQFAVKSLKKQIVVVLVGTGDRWRESVVGMLVAGKTCAIIDFRDVTSASLPGKLAELEKAIRLALPTRNASSSVEQVGLTLEQRVHLAPHVGDRVITHWVKWQFYKATIDSFNRDKLEYTVNFDDGDQTCLSFPHLRDDSFIAKPARVQPFNLVGFDRVPDEQDIAVGSEVFFPQGYYVGSGSREGGEHFHLGRITEVSKVNGQTLYSGVHLKGLSDAKWITYTGYSYTFHDYPLDRLRMSPNILDLL